MAETTMEPWSFTIVFDEDKAKKNGYEVDTLYDYVGKNVEGLGSAPRRVLLFSSCRFRHLSFFQNHPFANSAAAFANGAKSSGRVAAH